VDTVLYLEGEVTAVAGRKILLDRHRTIAAPRARRRARRRLFVEVKVDHFIDNGRPQDPGRHGRPDQVRRTPCFEVNP